MVFPPDLLGPFPTWNSNHCPDWCSYPFLMSIYKTRWSSNIMDFSESITGSWVMYSLNNSVVLFPGRSNYMPVISIFLIISSNSRFHIPCRFNVQGSYMSIFDFLNIWSPLSLQVSSNARLNMSHQLYVLLSFSITCGLSVFLLRFFLVPQFKMGVEQVCYIWGADPTHEPSKIIFTVLFIMASTPAMQDFLLSHH